MDVTSLAYRTDLTVLRLSGSEIADLGDHLVVRTPADPSYWWGNFVLLAEPVGREAVPGLLERYDVEVAVAEHVAWASTRWTARLARTTNWWSRRASRSSGTRC